MNRHKIKSIAIGSFDGMHLAHKALIDQVDALVIIERNNGYLTPGYKRSLYTDKACCFYHFEKVKSLTPIGFLSKLRADFPYLEKIVVGYDFHFGRDKAGNAEMLVELCQEEVVVVNEVSIDGISIHSRTIKAYLKEGKIDMAEKLLGRAYRIDGRVIHGQGLGKKELFPTINIKPKSYQLPKEGVYATRTLIDDVWLPSVSFFGHRVSTDGSFAVETHIIDKELGEVQDLVWIEFVGFIRNNKKFDTLSDLKKQISMDISMALAY